MIEKDWERKDKKIEPLSHVRFTIAFVVFWLAAWRVWKVPQVHCLCLDVCMLGGGESRTRIDV